MKQRVDSLLFYMEGGVLARRKRSENSVKENRMSFFPDYFEQDKVIAYSVLGGIPHYLKQWDQKLSVAENIKRNILTKGCILYSEVDFLLHQELRETNFCKISCRCYRNYCGEIRVMVTLK